MKSARIRVMVVLAVVFGVCTHAFGGEFEPKPVNVTVFKDGHALIMTRGNAVLDDGWCTTRCVPEAVLGAFWAFVNDEQCRVDIAKAGKGERTEERACRSIEEILRENPGKRVTVTDVHGAVHTGVLRGPGPEDAAESESPFIMLETDAGFDLLQGDQIRNVTIHGKEFDIIGTRTQWSYEIAVRVLDNGSPAQGEREVGFVYLQKGLRWIPNYRVRLHEDGQATITLQAAVINQLADLEDVDLRLVVGVPSFLMKDMLSPMAMRDRASDLGRYFAPPDPGRRGIRDQAIQGNTFFSNAEQVIIPAGVSEPGIPGVDLPAEGQLEDLFLYHRSGFSLKKGERALITLFEATVPYEDIYTLDVPAMSPSAAIQVMRGRAGDTPELRELVKANQGPKVMHEARLTNTSAYPWTTGPATVFKGDGVLGQQLLLYTSLKNKVDVPITIATDLNAKSEVFELRRENDVRINNEKYTNIALHGKLDVTNFKDKTVRLSITRSVIGTASEATHDGKIALRDQLEALIEHTEAWRWRINPMSTIEWELDLEAGKSITLEYDWNCYLRD
ncbi:MAG TPA: hypothetical protein HPP77_00455 [Candidatus Hydrogenedentes bacterium]|nr:hypothetical protein [Candidatus Hydrogenedentota bacterium]HIJ74531.1 hypothetical protein [Candidatus Hydrogenedentota bacterium]